ncbi:hypothetical protein [Pseudomonas poae]|uniref:hypothetical protein n=1 Tax=Pseudomonas poae TaxID=200451 RepID=UPI0035BE64E8
MLLVLGVVVLSGCVGKPVDKVTLEVDLPPEFRFIASAHYLPATGENCSLPQRRGKRPERKIFVTQYKPVAERVSLVLPLAEVIEGCPTVLRSVGFDLRAKWGVRYADVGGDHAVIGIRDRWDVVPTVPEPGVQAVFGTCQWLFRTLGPYHAIRGCSERWVPTTQSGRFCSVARWTHMGSQGWREVSRSATNWRGKRSGWCLR